MTSDEKLQELLFAVFDELREGVREQSSAEEYHRMKEDFAFHLTDWRDDLQQIRDLLKRPDDWSADDAARFLVGFLYHVVPHLTAARDLLLDAPASASPEKGKKVRTR
ncbi:MAG: hypothetical protein KY475_01970 [Planctomycetes bacterium]|nr:hypothetical protein [Planctomycetota bacterium]